MTAFLQIQRLRKTYDDVVAIDHVSLDVRKGNIYLPGATKDALKATPAFQYAKVPSPPKPKKIDDKH